MPLRALQNCKIDQTDRVSSLGLYASLCLDIRGQVTVLGMAYYDNPGAITAETKSA